MEKLFFTGTNDINLEGNLFITKEIWVGAATLNTNGALNLSYTLEGIGEIAPIFDGAINGDVSVSKEIATTASGWIGLASPVADAKCSPLRDSGVSLTSWPGASSGLMTLSQAPLSTAMDNLVHP